MTPDVMVWVAALLLAVAAALFVASPLAEIFSLRPPKHQREAEIMQLEHDHRLALAGIRELDFDHAMGKIGEPEYQTLRSRLETRALIAMASLARITEAAPDTAASASSPKIANSA